MKDTQFHKSHEEFTARAYNAQGILPDRYCFILTNRCNLRCDFCFQDKKPNKNAMNGDDWIKLAEQLPDYARVTMTGGEPFVFKDFNKVFSYVAERFNCNVISNGLQLNEKKIDYLLSYPKFRVLSISIDDIGNQVRGVKPKQWSHLEKMMKYFNKRKNEIKSDCLLDVKTMILDENAEELFDIYKYLIEEIGIDTHAFQFLKGSPIQHADKMFNIKDAQKKSEAYVYSKFDKIKEQLGKVREYNIKNEKISFLHPKISSLDSKGDLSKIDYINERVHDKDLYSKCKFPWSSVHINFDGNLFPCLAIGMGNVKEKSLSEIINSNEFMKFKNIIKKEGTIEACNRCGWLRPK